LSQLELAKDMEFKFHWEEEPLGTAGALRVVPDLGGTFLVMNGDILTSLSYRSLVDFHIAQGAALTIAMHRKRVDIDLGVIECDGGFVTGYREKPTHHYDVSMGIYVYDARALEHLPEGPCQFPDLVHRLLDAGERVAAFPAGDVDWYDIGTLEELERAAQEFERAPEKFGL
jgi:NDP-sugar pyrophosphorylase family protein